MTPASTCLSPGLVCRRVTSPTETQDVKLLAFQCTDTCHCAEHVDNANFLVARPVLHLSLRREQTRDNLREVSR